MKCPICKKEVTPRSAFVPFCSDRCRLIDLGSWASGRYVISTPAAESEDDNAAEPEHPGDEDK